MENSRVVLVNVMVIGWLSLCPLVVLGGLHKVGGSKGWHQDVNYTEWSSHEQVFVGDWLLFQFDKRYYNVLEVNKTSYENCIDRDFIKNITRGGRDVVRLDEARTYYYLSGGGYCFHGMKVAVNVEKLPAPAPASAPASAPAPAPAQSPFNMVSAGSHLPSMCTCTWIIVVNVIYVNLVLMGIL